MRPRDLITRLLSASFSSILLPVDRPWKYRATRQAMSWEAHLLNLALEGHATQPAVPEERIDAGLLGLAYETSTRITRHHSRTFYLASGLLPHQKKMAVRALYAFCRISDDIVDRSLASDPLEELAAWRRQSLTNEVEESNLVAIAWAHTRSKFGIPVRYAEQLLDGVAVDLAKNRYETFDELALYAYQVASTVGLMSMHIIGFSGTEAVPYAIKLGVALQITNILRDVGEDWENGRLYLPREELQQFGISEEDIAAGKVTPGWIDFMRYQIDRVRMLYAEAWPGIALLSEEGRFSIAAAANLYEAILDDIESHDYDVFTRRAHVSLLGKLRRLPGIWLRTKILDKARPLHD